MSGFREFWDRTRNIRTGLIVFATFGVGVLFGSQYNITAATQISLSAEEEKEFQAMWEAYDLLRDRYLDPMDTHTVVEGAISGMLEATGDQYTGYMPSDVYSLLDEDISGEIQGIGVVIRTIQETGEIEVANVMKDTPAERAGVQVGDIFVEVDGEEVMGYNQLELAGVVRGPRGSEVNIIFWREGELIEYDIERDRIPVPTVEHTILEGDIGLVRMFEFNPQSRPQFDAALEEMGVENLNGLILDVRGNPGGTLDSAIDLTSAFIEEGVILREEFANGQEDTLRANGNFADLSVPVVILVDETSASASELMAGALQDTDTATIIGETTFGKGTVQIWQGLSNGGGVRITIARWLTPEGSWIHEQGITPDVSVNWDPEGYFVDVNDPELLANDPQVQAAVKFLQEGDVDVDALMEEFDLEPETSDEMASEEQPVVE